MDEYGGHRDRAVRWQGGRGFGDCGLNQRTWQGLRSPGSELPALEGERTVLGGDCQRGGSSGRSDRVLSLHVVAAASNKPNSYNNRTCCWHLLEMWAYAIVILWSFALRVSKT